MMILRILSCFYLKLGVFRGEDLEGDLGRQLRKHKSLILVKRKKRKKVKLLSRVQLFATP